MTDLLKGLLAQALMAGLMLAGWGYDIEGARNVAAFGVWCVLLPVGLCAMFSPDWAKEAAAGPRRTVHVLHVTGMAVQTGTLLTLIWHGWTATGVAFGVFMLAGAMYRQQVAKYRAELEQGAADKLRPAADKA